ncbi:MAG: nickel-responsive transcriptional regulator NikR [Thermotogae bacterium]|nr:MAG: nickel-responsive transcriptional regulator NikR [Thermotogota bacterium]
MMGGVSRVSISLPPEMLEEFDRVVERLGMTRSKAVQVAMRDFLTEHRWETAEGMVAGAITLLYDHKTRGVEEEVTDIQHEFRDVISSTTHVHLDERNCLEIIAVKGDVARIRELYRRLMAQRVKQLKFSLLQI